MILIATGTIESSTFEWFNLYDVKTQMPSYNLPSQMLVTVDAIKQHVLN